jgi:hypothetical protein
MKKKIEMKVTNTAAGAATKTAGAAVLPTAMAAYDKKNKQPMKGTNKMKSESKTAPTTKVPLVVTTEHRGVFFGYGVPTTEKVIRLEQARMCVKWTSDVRGVVGLAANGPTKDCRIGPAAPAITLQKVTSIMEVSPEAEAKWKLEPWS